MWKPFVVRFFVVMITNHFKKVVYEHPFKAFGVVFFVPFRGNRIPEVFCKGNSANNCFN